MKPEGWSQACKGTGEDVAGLVSPECRARNRAGWSPRSEQGGGPGWLMKYLVLLPRLPSTTCLKPRAAGRCGGFQGQSSQYVPKHKLKGMSGGWCMASPC